MMKFGICVSLEQAADAAAAGFDFVELPLAPTLLPEDTLGWIERAKAVAGVVTRVPVDSFNLFLPGDLAVVGEAVDPVRNRKYVSAALRRAGKLGGKVVVFGSARSRMVPAGFDRSRATEQIEEFLRLCGPIAADANVTIAIEPLNTEECNIVNSVPEAIAIANTVNHPNIRVLSDLYHVAKEGQPYSETEAAGDFLAHVHVAGAENRRIPDARDTGYLAEYFRHLKQAGYDARIAIEGKIDDLRSEGPEALDTLRKAWVTA